MNGIGMAPSLLASYAARPDASRGRLYSERDVLRGPRDAFQRDRDRIIHSGSFRRLRHKTQVFVAPEGDHYRVRLTHSLEVAQIGRSIARVLGLNEDLTEALCLAHDIGHPPFGHAGERALDEAMRDHGGFDHNGHTLRTLMRLEQVYPLWPGLNLSWETLEGLAKHNGPVAEPGWALAACDADFPLALTSHASLEAQIAAIADDIAYDNHDIDDGLRAGLLTMEQLIEQPLIAEGWARVRNAYPGVDAEILQRELIRDQIGLMCNDVIAATRAAIADTGVATVDDVRSAGWTLGGFSSDMAQHERALKRFMYANLYHHPRQLAAAELGQAVVRGLFAAYRNDLGLIGGARADMLGDADETTRVRGIGDYIAGMTDRFAIGSYRAIHGDDAVIAEWAHHLT